MDNSKSLEDFQTESSLEVTKDPEHMCKLFVGGISTNTTEAALRQYFERWGLVTDVVIKKDPKTQKYRGFGFVTFASGSMVDNVQAARPHSLDGRVLEMKRALTREMLAEPDANMQTNRLFVGSLTENTREDELRMYFAQFGNIVNVVVLTDKLTGRSRNFGFVTFNDVDPVDKILLLQEHIVLGKKVAVRKAHRRNEMFNVGIRESLSRGDIACVCGGSVSWGGPNVGLDASYRRGHGDNCMCGAEQGLLGSNPGAGWNARGCGDEGFSMYRQNQQGIMPLMQQRCVPPPLLNYNAKPFTSKMDYDSYQYPIPPPSYVLGATPAHQQQLNEYQQYYQQFQQQQQWGQPQGYGARGHMMNKN